MNLSKSSEEKLKKSRKREEKYRTAGCLCSGSRREGAEKKFLKKNNFGIIINE